MKKIVFVFFFLTIAFMDSSAVEKGPIRGVKYTPVERVKIENVISIEIPKSWEYTELKSKDGKVPTAHIYNSEGDGFVPSVMIIVEEDDGNSFEDLKKKYMDRVYGKNLSNAKESSSITKYMDKNAAKKYAVYGQMPLAGTAFLCFLNYKDIKKTVIIVHSMVFMEKFPDDEWNNVIGNSILLLTSVER